MLPPVADCGSQPPPHLEFLHEVLTIYQFHAGHSFAVTEAIRRLKKGGEVV